MRKIVILAFLLLGLVWTAVAQAAQVTDVKWGVDKNNVLRLVVDVTDTAGYAVQLDGNNLKLTVNAKAAGQAVGRKVIKSSLADHMRVVSAGSATEVHVPLKKTLKSSDYKAFVLKKDPQTGRPFRVVLDLTADKTIVSVKSGTTTAGTAAVSKSAVSAPVVSNRPVVGNRPVRSSTATKQTVTKTTPAVKTPAEPKVVKTVEKKKVEEQKQEVKTTTKKSKHKKKRRTEKYSQEQKASTEKSATTTEDGLTVIKATGKYRTNGGLEGKVITIDPGHGGSDPGAVGAKGTKEKDITLAISKQVQELLEKKGAKVHMTRTDDRDVYGPYASDRAELQARVNVAEKYNSDAFVSLHINSSVNKSIGGFSTYYYPKTNYDLQLAQAIQKQLADNFGVNNLGVRQANFYVTKRCSMPAVLVEMCFISNPDEETLMQGNWFKKKTARLIVEALEKYFD